MPKLSSESTDGCPACGNTHFDDSLDSLGKICEECGLVLDDSSPSVPLEQNLTHKSSDDSPTEDWLAVCQVRNATEKRLSQAIDNIEETAKRLDIPADIRREAVDIYCKAVISDIVAGKDKSAISIACLRAASHQNDLPIPLHRLTGSPNVDQQQLRSSVATLKNGLDLSFETALPHNYVSFLTRMLGLSESQSEQLLQELKRVSDHPALIGKDPTGIAAAGVYLIISDLTQSEVADVVGVSTETIRQRANQLRDLPFYE